MNKYLEKIAEMSEQAKSDLTNTAVLGGIGGAEAMGMSKLYNTKPISRLSGKTKFGLGVGVTLAADYAGVKIGNALNKLRGAKQAEVPKPAL